MVLQFCLAVAITSSNRIPAEKVLLKLSSKQNQKFDYVNEIEMTNVDLGNLHASFGLRYIVRSTTATEVSEEVSITSNTFTGSSLARTPNLAQAKLAGSRVERTVDPLGNTLYDSGPSKIPIGMLFDLVFSHIPVGIGDSWTASCYTGPTFNNILVTFKLFALTKDEATITAESQKQEAYETLKPFIFVVDRGTGRCKSTSGKFRVKTDGDDFVIYFERTMVQSK